ncbi:MAG: ATPase domain-containing protein [Nitrososphaerales archaeon]
MTPPEFTGTDAMRKAASFRTLTSGSATLDGLLEGGYREGRVVEFLGRSSTGKTQLAMQAVLCASRRGKKALFIDTEGSFRPERLEGMAEARGWDPAGILERIICLRTDSFAEQVEVVVRMNAREATASCSLVVVDTLTRNFTIGLPGRSNLAERQGALDVYLSEIARDAYLNARAYLLTNRVTFGPSHDVAIGGRTVEQMVHASILLERDGGSVKATELSTGQSVLVSLSKAGVD